MFRSIRDVPDDELQRRYKAEKVKDALIESIKTMGTSQDDIFMLGHLAAEGFMSCRICPAFAYCGQDEGPTIPMACDEIIPRFIEDPDSKVERGIANGNW